MAVNYSSHYFNFEEVKVDFEEVEVDFEEVGRISRKSDGFRGSRTDFEEVLNMLATFEQNTQSRSRTHEHSSTHLRASVAYAPWA